MSAEATGWVWKHSPYRGAELLVHLAIADVVNDTHGNEFWMSTAKLAAKAKVSRSTVTTALSDMQARGLLSMRESGAAQRRPSTYRFEMTSAPTALVMREGWSSTSANSADSLDRTARAIPKEITQEPKAEASRSFNDKDPDDDCIRCHGDGVLYGTGSERRCSCTFVRDPALSLIEGAG